MAKKDEKEEKLSPDAQAEEGEVMEKRRQSAGAQAGKEEGARSVLAEALLSEGGEDVAPETEPLSRKELARLMEDLLEARRSIRYDIDRYGSAAEQSLTWKAKLADQLKQEVRRTTDLDMLGARLLPDLLDEEGEEWKDLIASKIDLISQGQKRHLCLVALESSGSTETKRFLIEEVLPNLETDAQNAVMERVAHSVYFANEEKRSLVENLFVALDLTPKTKGSILWELAEHDIDFVRMHIGEADDDLKETIVEVLSRKGYSLVEGEPVRKVESSLLLMEEMKRGFLLSDWREKNRDRVSFDLADAATLQKALEDVAQSRFKKPLDRLHPSEIKKLLTNETAREIDEKLLPEIEAKMEPSTFRLILQGYTKSFDRANRCMEALSKKWHRKSLDKLSTEKFRELLGRDEEIKEWIENDRFEQFTRGVYEEVARREAEQDLIYGRAVNHAQGAKEIQIQQIVSDFDAALEALPAVAATVQESLTNVREQMVQKIRDRYDTYFKELGDHHQKAKEWLRSRAKAWLDQATADIKSGKADIHYKREPEWKDQLDYGRDEGVSYLRHGQYYSEHEFVSAIIRFNNVRNLLDTEDELRELGFVQKDVAAGTL